MDDEPYAVPTTDHNYHSDLQPGPWRAGLKPLDVLQPEGPSFSVEGGLVKWQKWQMRVSFNYREGLVLHSVAYEDGGKLRPVLHRASLVEMAVPYGDPKAPWTRKCAFDVSDYGLGYCANSLGLGCDCLGSIYYFDATLSDSKGRPKVLPRAVCMHEEDAGLLWKHVEYRTGHSESRRSRRLVLSFISTVVNYEYAFYWSFYQDGSIGYEIKLTGELSTNHLKPGEGPLPGHGTLVAPGVNAQHHQHMFCARLDFAVDDAAGGKDIVVSEVDAVALPMGPGNPAGMGFVAQETKLTSTAKAQRKVNFDAARIWKVSNPSVLNPMSGAPVAYKLVPQPSPPLLSAPGSVTEARAVFATKNLWVTPHSDAEKFPAGDYVFCGDACTGLSVYAKEDKPLAGADPVIWYSFGVTHVVRVEDFPVMPCEVTGFHIKPFGFFSGNPSLDIPPGSNKASTLLSAPNGAACCGGAANGCHTNGGHANGDA
ncbi:MAG: copper amine oxidase [Monoraphidium minutum]|nr:MAG: copper amine oxidase [Monoraphidium minutum]